MSPPARDQRRRPTEQPHSTRRAPTEIEPRVLKAAIRVLAEVGWDELSLERVAESAGLSRVTLWRQGVGRETLVEALLARLAQDYRDSMWTVLTAAGSGRKRLEQALHALCGVADRHLELLLASDSAFHRAWAQTRPQVSFVGPFIRIVEDGVAEGSLRELGESHEVADLLFNTVCWPYVHLRGRHRWSSHTASARVIGLVLQGIAAESPEARRAPGDTESRDPGAVGREH